MALLESKSFQLGVKASDFNLLNALNDKFQTLSELKGEKVTIIKNK